MTSYDSSVLFDCINEKKSRIAQVDTYWTLGAVYHR